jgi:hypothetical protein
MTKMGTVLSLVFSLLAYSVFANPPAISNLISYPQVIDRISRAVTKPTPNQFRNAQLCVNLSVDQNEPEEQEKGWIQKHGTVFGALVGFGGGWAIGYAGGDDGLIDDGGKGLNGLIGGGIGAAAGAVIGKLAIH